jgi:hypothetical protein
MIRAGLWLDAEKVTDLDGREIRRTSEPHDVENAPETSWNDRQSSPPDVDGNQVLVS